MQLPSRHFRVDPLRGWSRCPAHYALRARSAGVHALGVHPYLPNTTGLANTIANTPISVVRASTSAEGDDWKLRDRCMVRLGCRRDGSIPPQTSAVALAMPTLASPRSRWWAGAAPPKPTTADDGGSAACPLTGDLRTTRAGSPGPGGGRGGAVVALLY